jgi:hypothetical protein
MGADPIFHRPQIQTLFFFLFNTNCELFHRIQQFCEQVSLAVAI